MRGFFVYIFYTYIFTFNKKNLLNKSDENKTTFIFFTFYYFDY
jgi:hypothetical protein